MMTYACYGDMRNIALIVLDSVRKDVFDRVCTRLRAEADVEYEQCRAASTWSVPSHASLLTGELPHEHGIHTHRRHYHHVSKTDMFLDRLPKHRTLGVSANVFASDAFGFDQFFDEFVSISADRRFPDGIDAAKFGQECEYEGLRKHLSFARTALKHEHSLQSLLNGALVTVDNVTKRLPFPKPLDKGAVAVERAADRLTTESEGEEPFFLFANFMDAHGPLTPTRGFDHRLYDAPNTWTSEDIDWNRVIDAGDNEELERYDGLYEAAVDYLDQRVSAFVETVRQETDQPTTFVVTADHGENMGRKADDYLWEHSDSSLTEGLLHVPAVVIDPPGRPDSTAERYVSHVDFPDLLVALAHGEFPDVTREEIAAERVGNNKSAPEEDRMLRCVYSGDTKYCWDSNGMRRRFRLDPGRPSWQEAVDGSVPVERLEPEFFSNDIETALEEVLGSEEGEALDEATEAKLRDLGYL